MITILLIIIYIAFISLGLPDAMLGAAWPTIQASLALPIAGAGLISMIISGGTILSSTLSGRLIERLGTGKVTLASVALTAMALLGFSWSHSYLPLCLLAVPLGLGAGAVDAALNQFVALHYSARHMNWLHCFWGVGATAGPVVMSFAIARQGAWQLGYRIVALIQIVLVLILMASLPIWRIFHDRLGSSQAPAEGGSRSRIRMLPGIRPALLGFFSYCALETTAGLWGASYLVQTRGVTASIAAGWVSLYYLGITLGRFANGILTARFSNPTLIRGGQVLIGTGAGLLLLFSHPAVSMAGLILIGLGCAPIFPSMLHETPVRFGAENTIRLMGLQMAFAYMGTTLVPPTLGLLMAATGVRFYPALLGILLAVLLASSERTLLTAHWPAGPSRLP